jgi:hypothetical protein
LCYQDAPVEQWSAVLREVALAGFDHVDLTDSWLRPGDLSPDRAVMDAYLAGLEAAREAGHDLSSE